METKNKTIQEILALRRDLDFCIDRCFEMTTSRKQGESMFQKSRLKALRDLLDRASDEEV